MNSLNKTLNMVIHQIIKLFQMKNFIYLFLMNLIFMQTIFAELTWQLPAQDVFSSFFNQNLQITTSSFGSNVHLVWENNSAILFTSSSNDFGNNWSSVVLIDTGSGRAQIATDDSGQYAYIVYADFAGAVIKFSRSIDFGQTWTLGTSQKTLALPSSFRSQITTNRSGQYVYAVWNYVTGGVATFSRSIDFGENWPVPASAITLSDTSTLNVNEPPQIVTSDSGQYVHVIWAGLKAPATIKQVQISNSSDFGVTWTSFTNIPKISTSDANASDLDLATDGSGKYVYVVWQKSVGGATIVQFSRSQDFGVTWIEEITLSSTTAAVISKTPRVVTDKTGKYVYIIWAQTGALGDFVQVRRSTDFGETFESSVSLSSSSNPLGPDIVTDNIGRYVYAVWFTGNLVESSLSFDFGVNFTFFPIMSPPGTSLAFPVITTAGSGIYAYSAFDIKGGSLLQVLNGIDIPRTVKKFKFTRP